VALCVSPIGDVGRTSIRLAVRASLPDTRRVAETIALFPLDYVLLPGVPMPLHVFEPRYRRLIADVGTRGSFGVVLGNAAIRRSTQPVAPARGTCEPADTARAQPMVAAVGTLAEIIEYDGFPDGRCDLLTAGTRRFRILETDAVSQPYLQARVEFLDEPAGANPDTELTRARPLISRYLNALARLTDHGLNPELADEPVCASYQVASLIQLTNDDRQDLLCHETAADRLGAVVTVLRRELALLSATRAVPVPSQALHLPASMN
jgi:uncharacterized protein